MSNYYVIGRASCWPGLQLHVYEYNEEAFKKLQFPLQYKFVSNLKDVYESSNNVLIVKGEVITAGFNETTFVNGLSALMYKEGENV